MKKLDFLPNLKNKYSIRRFTVGTASILIGSLLFLGHNTETQAAEETDNPTEAEVANETNDNHSSTQETQNVPSETATQLNKDDSANNLKDVQNQALQQVSALQHLSAEQSSSFTNEIKNAVSQASVQAVVEKALAADNQAAQQAENENKQPVKEPETVEEPKNEVKNEATKEVDSKVEQPTENQETKQKSVEAESKVKADNSKTDEVEHQAATPAPEAKENKEVNPVHTENNIASESLATEQKVEKVKAELSAQRSTEEVDEALALIDTEGLTAEEIKAEVTKLLFKRGLAEKEFYSPKAVLPRKEDEPVYSTRAAFDINTDLKDEVVVTKDNFNDYFWTVDDASYDPETGIATLTPNEPSKKGAITLDTKLNVNKDFHFSGEVNLGDKYEGHPKNGEAGGDGISFAFNPGKTHDLGLYGSALGVGGLPFAFGFKLDTYVNNSPKAAEKAGPDPKPFDTKGAFGAFVWADGNGRVTTQPGTGTWKAALLNEPPEDNKFRPFTIDYDGDTKDMTITYAGQTWKQNMKNYFNYTHKDVYALGITASTGGGYNLQQVKINEFTYTAAALLAEYFVDQDLQKPIDKPLRTSGDIDSVVDVLDHSAYLQSKGYQLVSKDTSLAPEYNAAASHIKLTNASQFIVYAVKDIQAPEIGEVPAATGELNAPITPIVLDVTDNSGSVASTQVTGLPAGLTFDEKTNTISGTPTALGNNTVTITATDHAGLKTEKTFTFTVADTQKPTIDTVENKTSEAFTPITPIVLSADDNSKVAPTLTVTGLPAGLTFDPATKQITGTPTAEGTSTVTITATDASNNTSTSTFEYTVQPNAALNTLKAAVADAKTVNKDDYTPDSVKALEDKVAEGEALLAHPENGTPEQFNAKAQEIKDAKDALKQKANKDELNKSITAAEALPPLKAGNPLDDAVKNALEKAKEVQANQNADQPAVDKAKTDLDNAVNAKKAADEKEKTEASDAAKAKQDALDALKAELAKVEKLNKDDYTPETVQPLSEKETAGKAVVADADNKSVDEIKEATEALKQAENDLVKKANKDELEKSIAKAEGLGQLDPADAEDKAVQDALDKAKEVQANQNANQAAVDKAKTDLDNAIKAKENQVAKEKTDAAKAKEDALKELKAELEKVAQINKDDFTPDSVAPLTDKENEGKAIVAAPDAKTTDEIKAATQALKDAEAGLVKRADKGDLEKAIEKANALGQLDSADAEDKAVQDAVAAGQKVKDDADATPEQVAKATKNINDAVAAKERQDALDELNKAIDAAQRIEKADYTAQSVAPLDTAKQAGEKLTADNQATTEQLKEATKLINDAINQLVPDKSELDKIIEVAKGLEPLNNSATDRLLKHALDAAIAVQNNPNATPQEIKEATWNLEDEIGNKLAADAIEALRNAVNKSKALKEENYTPDSFAPLKKATTEGQSILDDPSSADVPTIMDKTKEINQLIDALKEKADKTALEEALDKAVAYENLDDNDAEDKAVHDALIAGQEVEGDLNATPEEVKKATDDLNKAIAAKEHQDALDELNKAIDAANAVTKDDFTPNSVKSLEEAVKDGEAVKADAANKTPEELRTAAKAINDAKDALQAKANKDGLNNSIQTAESLGNLDQADAEDKAVKEALDKAKAVQADQNATQAEVDAAKDALDKAIQAKADQDKADTISASLDALKAELEKAKAVNKDEFTPNSVKPLTDATDAGQAIIDAPEGKTAEEIDKATQAIKDTLAGLQAKADKDGLNSSIQTAEGLGNLDPADAEDKTVKEALDKAKAVQADQNADQATVDQAKTDLDNAIKAKQDQDAKDSADAAKAKQDALDELKAELAKVKAINKYEYTPNTVAPLNEKETAGEAVVADADNKSVDEIKEATKALKDAEAALVKRADKTALEEALDKAVAYENLDDNDAEDKAVHEALLAGQEVEGDLNATPEEVQKATDDLNKAIAAKEHQDALDELNKAIDAANAVVKDNFTPDSVKPLEDAVKAGETVKADAANKTPEELKAAVKAINDAKDALQAKADKTELDKSITAAEGLGNLDSEDAEDKVVKDALDKAKAVQEDQNVTQAEVDQAKTDLDNAIKAKQDQDAKDSADAAKAKQDALDELKAELAKVEKLNKDDYTPNTVAPLNEKETAGNAVVADADNKSMDEIKEATEALKQTENNLVKKADKEELEKSIQAAEGLGNLNPADAEDKTVKDALDKAKAVQADPNATQAEVDAAKDALDKAVQAKADKDKADAIQAALDALKAELEKAKAVNKDNFTPNSVKPLTESANAGQAIVDAPKGKTVEEIEKATQALKDALAGLQAKADKAELDKSITAAEGLGNLHSVDTEDKAVKDALDKAKAVQANPNATQAEVDAAKDALNKAVQAKADQDKADAIQAALDALKKAIDRAKTTSTSNCTEQSVKVLEEAVKNGESIIKGTEKASLKEIQNATEAINKAIDNLEAKKTTVAPTDKTKTNVENSVTQPASQTNIKHKHHTTKETAKNKANKNKAKVLPNTGQDSTSVDPKYASLMFAIGGLMMFFRKCKNEDKDNTEK